jgi:hypothetical protein
MVEVDPLIISNEIDKYGSTVSIKTWTAGTYSDYGDEIKGTASTSVTIAVVNILTSDMQEVKEGLFKPGDKRFFFKADETVNVNDWIIHGLNSYLVKDLQEHELNDTVYSIEATCARVDA